MEEHSKCIFLPFTDTAFAFSFKFAYQLIIYLLLRISRERGRKIG